MTIFDFLNINLEKVCNQCENTTPLEKFVQNYTKQADEADRALLEKQALERESREGNKN